MASGLLASGFTLGLMLIDAPALDTVVSARSPRSMGEPGAAAQAQPRAAPTLESAPTSRRHAEPTLTPGSACLLD
jgi:hypothetical protein